MRIKLLMLLLVASVCTSAAMARHTEEDEDDYHLDFGTVTSTQAMTSGGHQTASSMLLAADHANKSGHPEEAIKICQKGLQLDPEDIDLHMCYAECLEKKLRKQVEKDPDLFIATVKQWLIVARSERGDEKGLTGPNGMGIPILVGQYKDEDRQIPAMRHIVQLVGFKPKAWESDQKFMKKVEDAAEASVKGRIVQKKTASKSESDD